MAVATGLDAMTRESLSGAGAVAEDLDVAGMREMMSMSDVPTLRERAQRVPWSELCEARDFIVGLARLTRAMLVPAEHQGAPEVLGLREFGLASDLMHAVGALVAVSWLTKFSGGRCRDAVALPVRNRRLSRGD